MVMATRGTVVGVFMDQGRARDAVRDLRDAGFREDQIGLAGRNAETGTNAAEGAGMGAAVGAAGGAGVGALWALGIAAGMLPAIGPVIAGGLLASVLASAAGAAATGAAVGGLVGALTGLGVPEEEARYYESEFTAGRTVVTVRAEGRAAEAAGILSRHGAYDMSTRAGAGTTTTGTY